MHRAKHGFKLVIIIMIIIIQITIIIMNKKNQKKRGLKNKQKDLKIMKQ